MSAVLKKPLKHRKCRVCKTVFQPDRPMQPYCGPGCALTFVRKTRAKAEKRERRAALKRLRTRRDWLKLCQQAFNAYIRTRDEFDPCICCGKFTDDSDLATGSRWDAGHYRSTGAAPHLRFNEDNAHKQRVVCNRNKSGNIVEYRKRLIEKIGLERVEALEADNTSPKWTIEELEAMTKDYRARKKQLERTRPGPYRRLSAGTFA